MKCDRDATRAPLGKDRIQWCPADFAGGEAVDEQSQQDNLEEKLKDSVDCLTDKRYLWLLASFSAQGL